MRDIVLKDQDTRTKYSNKEPRDDSVQICFITAFETNYDEFRRVFPRLNLKCFARKPISG